MHCYSEPMASALLSQINNRTCHSIYKLYGRAGGVVCFVASIMAMLTFLLAYLWACPGWGGGGGGGGGTRMNIDRMVWGYGEMA